MVRCCCHVSGGMKKVYLHVLWKSRSSLSNSERGITSRTLDHVPWITNSDESTANLLPAGGSVYVTRTFTCYYKQMLNVLKECLNRGLKVTTVYKSHWTYALN